MDRLEKDLKKVYESESIKNKHFQEIKTEKKMMQAKKEEIAKIRKAELKRKERERQQYLKEKLNQRNQLLGDIKEALKEDIEQKKEINYLRKIDQEENYKRGKNFHELYKAKLVEKLMEKQERAQKVKEQQMRIAAMCSGRGDPMLTRVAPGTGKAKSQGKVVGPLNASSIF